MYFTLSTKRSPLTSFSMIYDLFSLLLLLPFTDFVYTDTIVFLLIFSLGYLHLQSCHLDTFLRTSQSPIFKLQSLLTTLLEHEAEKKLRHRRRRLFASRHGSNFLHGCPFQVLVVLPFRSWNTTWDLETVYWVEQEKFPKFSSCSSTFLKTCAVTAKKYLILYSMESTWSQDKLPRGHNFRRNGNDSIEWPGSSPPYKVHNLVKSLTFPSTTSSWKH